MLKTEQDLFSISWQTVDCLDYGVKDTAGDGLIPFMRAITTDQALSRELDKMDNNPHTHTKRANSLKENICSGARTARWQKTRTRVSDY